MKRSLGTALAVLFFLAGCASSQVKYTPEEIKDYPPSVQEHIQHGEITTGMTMQQVRYAWGGPDEVRVLGSSDDGRERVEWTYKKAAFFKTRLIFTGDKLTEILSSEPGAIK
jgi:hypothetical protein